MVIDTGSSKTMIAQDSALAIGIKPALSSRQAEITTASGLLMAPLVVIPVVECYGVQIKNLDVICHSLPPDSGLDGLLGLDFLRAAKIILNFHTHILEIPEI